MLIFARCRVVKQVSYIRCRVMTGSHMYQVQITAGVLEEKQDQSYSRLQVYQVPMCTRCRVIASRDVHQVCQIREFRES